MKTTHTSKTDPSKGTALALPVLADDAQLSALRSQTGLLSRFWSWLQARRTDRSSDKRLRVAETVSLGEKRFVAVVQVDGRHFLLAGGPTNIALLAQLDTNEPFEDVLRKTMTVPPKPPAKRKRAKRAPKQAAPTPSPKVASESPFSKPATFGDLVQNAIAAGGDHTAKSARKNGHSAIGNSGQYA
jgi:flagellar biogenesis protein FliO